MDDQIIDHLVGLGARLRRARQDAGLNQKDFGAIGGVGLTTQQQYESGKTPPNAEYLYRLHRYGIDVAELMIGETLGPPRGADRPNAVDVRQRELEGLVSVEEIDLAYGMGAAFTHDAVSVRSHLFPLALLETITSTPPSKLTIARGMGDSMMPTLHDGDMVIIDRSQRTVRDQDAIWALTVGDIAMIKRLRVKSDRVLLLSDNERVPPDEATHDEINIVGRVIFIGRRM
ncbi:helix-turn-helix transcriptional regulator [Sphingomonas paucimobilis]|uniref:XRE family transcriptional regulator n=1 Tax=Sphingomonas paucimobilis TaxID=13689 RepID=UPI001962F85C|nr:S24 family peptidase [Sphingomonas paucimobilis]QRY97127.1 helix-turn-helix transcriptional regulator [Sphingomonas paucimobilis]